MIKLWKYLYNTFLIVTASSRKKMNIITNHHYAALDNDQSDPDIGAMFTRYQPEHQTWQNLYSTWIANKGIWHGRGVVIDTLLDDLSPDQLDIWESEAVIAVGKNSPEYQTVFVGGRAPYTTGNKDQRISEVNALAERMNGIPSLATLQATVQAYHISLDTARNEQQMAEQASKNANDAIEAQREVIGVLQYGDLGLLMDKFRDTPNSIEQFYPLEVIRSSSNNEETPIDTVSGTVPISSQITVYEDDFIEVSSLQVQNDGPVPLAFFLTENKGEAASGPEVMVESGEVLTLPIAEFGDPTYTWLNARNDDKDEEGSYVVTLLE